MEYGELQKHFGEFLCCKKPLEAAGFTILVYEIVETGIK